MSELRTFIVEKIFLVGSLLFVTPSPDTKQDSMLIKNDTVIHPLRFIQGEQKNIITDSLDPKVIIEDAKQTVDKYNESVKEKREVEKKAILLSKQKIENTKRLTKLTAKVITRTINNQKNIIEAEGYSKLKKDSTCSRTFKYLLQKERKCIEYKTRYYITKREDTIVLGIIKNKIRW